MMRQEDRKRTNRIARNAALMGQKKEAALNQKREHIREAVNDGVPPSLRRTEGQPLTFDRTLKLNDKFDMAAARKPSRSRERQGHGRDAGGPPDRNRPDSRRRGAPGPSRRDDSRARGKGKGKGSSSSSLYGTNAGSLYGTNAGGSLYGTDGGGRIRSERDRPPPPPGTERSLRSEEREERPPPLPGTERFLRSEEPEREFDRPPPLPGLERYLRGPDRDRPAAAPRRDRSRSPLARYQPEDQGDDVVFRRSGGR